MNTEQLQKWLGVGLMVLGGMWIVRHFWGTKNNLEKHMEVEGDLQWASTAVVNPTTEAALMQYPLTTIGDTPFAGLHLDPFNRDNPAAQPKPLDYLQFIVNNQVPQTYDLGRMLADPNATKR